MTTKYYVDDSGNYLGGFSGASPPEGSVEVATPPGHGLDKWVNGAWVPAVSRLKAEVSAKRYDVEVAAINFTYRTAQVPISTSRDSQAKLDAARNIVKDTAWVDGTNWKCADGKFRPMTSAEVLDMVNAVRVHILACYDTEAQKFAEIDATGTTDLNTGWPATVNTPTTIYFTK